MGKLNELLTKNAHPNSFKAIIKIRKNENDKEKPTKLSQALHLLLECFMQNLSH